MTHNGILGKPGQPTNGIPALKCPQGGDNQLAKGVVLAVWAAAVNSKFSVKEACHVKWAPGLVLHEVEWRPACI